MTRAKKIRGWRRALRDLELWSAIGTVFPQDQYDNRSYAYFRIRQSRFYRLFRTKLPAWFDRKKVRILLKTYQIWKEAARAQNQSHEVFVVLDMTDFHKSDVIAAKNHRIEFYKNRFEKAENLAGSFPFKNVANEIAPELIWRFVKVDYQNDPFDPNEIETIKYWVGEAIVE